MSRITRAAALAAVLTTVAALAGCGGGSDESSNDNGGSTELSIETPAASGEADAITWAVYRETNSLDPIFAFDYPENTALTTMCESLLQQQPDGSIAPGLATEVTNPNPLTYSIKVRPGVTFWDGSPLTASDVVYSLERARNPKLGGFYSGAFDRVKRITATSPSEVTISLTKPDYWLRGELSSMAGMIVERRFVEQQGQNFGTVKGGTMCTGAFKLSSWKTGQGITVVRNDDYWNQDNLPKTKQITIIGVPDDASLTASLQTGEVDGVYSVQLTTLNELRQSSDVSVYEGPSFASNAFIVSDLQGTLKDVRVRQALSLAIDRQGLLDTIQQGAGQLPRAMGNPGTWGYAKDVFQSAWDALPEPTQNIEEAKKLIEQAGATGKLVRIGTSSEIPSLNTQAAAFKSAAEQIGLKAELVSLSAANYINFFIDPKAREQVDGFFTVNYPDFADPGALYATFVLPNGSQNYSGYKSPAAIAALEKARAEADDETRAEDVTQAQKVIADELPWIPMILPNQVLVMNKDITGAPASFQYMFGPWAPPVGSAG